MNKRQRKKVWKKTIGPLHVAWFGAPLPRRVTHGVIARLSAHAWCLRMDALVLTVVDDSPLLRLFMANHNIWERAEEEDR